MIEVILSRRLNIWDFDDTLAWSARTVEEFKRRYPQVENWRWWHDPKYSTEAALETLPVLEMWSEVASTDGDHWILTGRTLPAVKEWFSLWKDHPTLGHIVNKITRVVSTSGGPFQHRDTHQKKKQWIEDNVKGYEEIHVYDDSRQNIETIEEIGGIVVHLIRNGREVYQGKHYLWTKSASKSEDIDKDLQIIYNGIKSLTNLKDLSTTKTYTEIFKATLDILQDFQRDILKNLATKDLFDLFEHQLSKLKIEIDGNLKSIPKDIDEGKEVEISFRFDELLTNFYKAKPNQIDRALYSLGIQIESTFDKLQQPYGCKILDPIKGKDGITVGYTAKIWKF